MTIELQISELVDLLESKPAPVFSEDPEKERLDRTTAFLRRLGETHAKISEDGKVSLSREAANDLFNLHNEYQNGVYDGIELTITNDGNGILDLLDHLYPAPETRPEITAKELKSLFDYVEEVKKTALFAPSETPLEIGQLANFDDVSLHRYNLDKIKRAASENQTVWDPINIYVQYSTTMGGALTGKVHKRLKEFIAELKADPIFSVPDSPEDILILEPTQVAEMGAKLEAFNARKRDIGLDWAALKEVLEPGYTTAGDDQQAVNAKLEEFQQALTAKGLVEWPLDKPMTISAELANDLFRQYENFKQSGQIDFKPGQAAGKGALDMLEHFARKAAADGEAVDAKQLREAQDYISYLNTKYPHIAGMPGQLKDNQSLTVYAAPNTLEQFKIARTLTNGNEVLSSFEIFRRVQDARAIFSTESDKQIERFCEQLVQDGAAQRAAQSTLQNLIIVTPDQSHALKDKFSEFQKKERDAALTPPAPTKNITLNLNRVEDALEPGYSLMPETNKEPLTTKILDFITALSKTGHLERTPDNKQINISAELANDLFRQYENFKQSGEIDFKPGQAAGKGALDVLAHVRNKAMAGPETVDAQELRHAHDYITDISAKQPLAAGLPGQLKDDQALQGNVIPWRFEQFNIAKSLQGDNKVLNNFEIFNRLYPNTPKPTFAGDLQQQIARFCTQLVKDGAATEAPHGLIITTPAQRLALRDKFHDFQNKERDATKEETVFNVERLAKFLNGSNLAYEPQDIQDFMEDLKRNHTVTGATGKDGELNITPTLMKNLATFHDQFKKRQPYAIPPLTLNIEFLYARFRRDTQPKSPSEHDQRLLKGFIRELSQDSSFPSRYGNTPDTLIIDARLEPGLNAKFNIFMEKVALFERLASLENDPSRSTNDAPA
ncbi:MAG TPA: hypothetical protein VM532_05195, partial [Burkholderiales bacterium]|nr:hypothetical protein [Burkholderiales bacterium]